MTAPTQDTGLAGWAQLDQFLTGNPDVAALARTYPPGVVMVCLIGQPDIPALLAGITRRAVAAGARRAQHDDDLYTGVRLWWDEVHLQVYARTEDFATEPLTGQVLPGLGPTPLDQVFRTLALSHVRGLGLREAIDAAVMVYQGCEPGAAVIRAEADTNDPLLKTAALTAAALMERVRTLEADDDPATTMADVRDGDTIRLNGRELTVAAIERGTVAYIYTGHGPELTAALDAPVAILHRASTGESPAAQGGTR